MCTRAHTRARVHVHVHACTHTQHLNSHFLGKSGNLLAAIRARRVFTSSVVLAVFVCSD